MSAEETRYNQLYLEKIASEENSKVARASEAWIEDHMREAAFCRSIIKPVPVTPDDPFIQTSVHHDTLVAMVELQPESRAMVTDYRGRPDARLVSAERIEVPFFTVSSELFQAYEEELWAYSQKLTKKVEEQAALDVEEIEDREWVLHSDAACQALQEEFNGGSATALHKTTIDAGTVVEYSVRKSMFAREDANENTYAWPMQKQDVIDGAKLFTTRRLRCETVVLPDNQFLDISGWTMDEVGDTIAGETTKSGFNSDKLIYYKYVRTIKADILRPGNIYFYTAEQYLGRFYILQKLKFWVDKEQNIIEWRCWEHIAQCLVNIGAVAKIETYSCDASNADANSLQSSVQPVAEKAIGATNNRVADGTVFPSVEFY